MILGKEYHIVNYQHLPMGLKSVMITISYKYMHSV